MDTTDLKNLAKSYSHTEQGQWLNDIPWITFPVKIKDLFGEGSAHVFTDTIFLKPQDREDTLFGFYVHELRHKWQQKKQGIILYALRNLLRLNEPDADQQTELGILFYGEQKFGGHTTK